MKAFPWIELRPVFVTFRTRDDLPASTGPIHAMPRGIGMHVLPPPSARLARLFETAAPDGEAAQALVVALRSEDLRPLVSRVQVRGRRSRGLQDREAQERPRRPVSGFQNRRRAASALVTSGTVWARAEPEFVSSTSSSGSRAPAAPRHHSSVSGVNADYRDHGVGVLGILVAEDDDAGSSAYVPRRRSRSRRSSDRPTTSTTSTMPPPSKTRSERWARRHPADRGPDALPGVRGKEGYPLRSSKTCSPAFQEATERGIIVDRGRRATTVWISTRSRPTITDLPNRGLAEFEDSGAIMVGACRTADSKLEHHWLDPSNYGSRVSTATRGVKRSSRSAPCRTRSIRNSATRRPPRQSSPGSPPSCRDRARSIPEGSDTAAALAPGGDASAAGHDRHAIRGRGRSIRSGSCPISTGSSRRSPADVEWGPERRPGLQRRVTVLLVRKSLALVAQHLERRDQLGPRVVRLDDVVEVAQLGGDPRAARTVRCTRRRGACARVAGSLALASSSR